MSDKYPEPGTSKGQPAGLPLLDFPGIGIGLTSDEEEEAQDAAPSQQPTTSSRRVSAVPSGAGLTFLMRSAAEADGDDDDDEDLDDLDNPARFLIPEFVEPGSEPCGQVEMSTGVVGGGDVEDEDSDSANAKREKIALTDKYLKGQLTLRDFVREFNISGDDDNENEEDDSESDGDWRPSKKKKAVAPTPSKKKALADSDDEEEGEENHRDKFEAEMDQTQRQQLGKRSKRVGVKQRRKRLAPALQCLMGEANLRYARGDLDTAVRMCMEVIKEDPSAPEPFQTLAALYEDSGEQDRSLQYALIAAHLAPQDPEEWARLADMSTGTMTRCFRALIFVLCTYVTPATCNDLLELGDLQQAVACYRKAINADLENVRYHHARCSLLEQVGEKKAALRGFKRLQQVVRVDKEGGGAEYLRAAKEIARLLHERGEIEEAKNALAEASNKFPDDVKSEDINLLLELLLELSNYEEALEVLCVHSRAQFASETPAEDLAALTPEQQLKEFTSVVLPNEGEETPLDIVSKMVVVLINLKAEHLVVPYTDQLLETDPEDCGDLFLDVAENYMAKGLYQHAQPFLEKLVHSESFGQAAVWLRYGECHFELGNLESAEAAYARVVEMAPGHHDARRTLSNILHRLGKNEEALETLDQDAAAELLNPTLLYERCTLLLSEGCTEEFIEKAKMLFNRHFVTIRSREELHAIASAKKLTSKNKALSQVRAFNRIKAGVGNDDAGPEFEKDSEIALPDEFALFRKLCDVLYELKRFGELQRVTFSAMGSPYFNKKAELVKECEFLCLLSSFLNGDSYHAYNLVRELVLKDVDNSRIWNLFNLVIMRADDVRHNRFLMRLMQRNQDNVALGILNGHNCLVAGTYKYSLGEYMSAFKQDPTNPMVALMLGLTFTHMACQKFSAKKHSLVVQSCAFLNTYLHLRGRCQESYYNLGRAMHQLGLLPAALHYYKKALDLKPAVGESGGRFDLRRETAFNISLIYQGSGADQIARMYIEKYIVV